MSHMKNLLEAAQETLLDESQEQNHRRLQELTDEAVKVVQDMVSLLSNR